MLTANDLWPDNLTLTLAGDSLKTYTGLLAPRQIMVRLNLNWWSIQEKSDEKSHYCTSLMIQYSNVFRSYLNGKLGPKWDNYSNELVEQFPSGASRQRTVDCRGLVPRWDLSFSFKPSTECPSTGPILVFWFLRCARLIEGWRCERAGW